MSRPPKQTGSPKHPDNQVTGLKRVPSKRAKSPKKPNTALIHIDPKGSKHLKSTIELIVRNLKNEPSVPFPRDLKPMLSSTAAEPFDDEDWQFEIKWDGYRALAYLNEGQVQLVSRNNNSFENKFAPVYECLQQWPIKAVVDGEIVVLNTEGKADFKAIQDWGNVPQGQLVYYVFDILWLEGLSLLNLPLYKRREILQQIMPDNGTIRYSDSIDGFGIDFYKIAKENGLEGIIAKQKNAVYHTGHRTKTWMKIKVEQRHEAIVCGYTKKRDTTRQFSSLLLGRYEGGKLVFIGQVGTGFSLSLQKEILKKLEALETKTSPFLSMPRLADPTVYVSPSLVCEVKYTELTPEGVMRHPSFQGLREDKSVEDINPGPVVLKKAVKNETRRNNKARAINSNTISLSGDNAIVTLNDQELKFTNTNKVFWIKEGITKGDMLHYYYQVMPFIFPYMKDRPQSLNRFPNGVDGKSFYQKNMAGKVEPWIKTFRRLSESSTGETDFMICTNEASLLYMVNLGCIELNPWHSRAQSPLYPDWSVIDLDPGDISFEKVIETALVVKKVLDSLQIESYPKTSGSTGIHIYVPLGAKYNYEQSKQFAELVVNLVHEELPSFTSLIRNPLKRKDKIYLDYLQNRPIQTICAPYSIRPKPGATVSAPLHWSEVKKGLKMEDFSIDTILERLKVEGDLFSGVLKQGLDLNKVVKKLSGLIHA